MSVRQIITEAGRGRGMILATVGVRAVAFQSVFLADERAAARVWSHLRCVSPFQAA